MAVDVISLIVPLAVIAWAAIYVLGVIFEWWFWGRRS